jgi:hypothetical protein
LVCGARRDFLNGFENLVAGLIAACKIGERFHYKPNFKRVRHLATGKTQRGFVNSEAVLSKKGDGNEKTTIDFIVCFICRYDRSSFASLIINLITRMTARLT